MTASTPSETKAALGLDSSLFTGGAGTPTGDVSTSSGAPETIESAPTVESESTAEQGTEDVATGQALFGSLSPQEAGRRSARVRAERALAGETEQVDGRADEIRTVRVNVQTGQILKKLSEQAKGGNVQAARELRGWLADLPVEADTEVSSLDRKTRQAVLARVLAELDAAEPE